MWEFSNMTTVITMTTNGRTAPKAREDIFCPCLFRDLPSFKHTQTAPDGENKQLSEDHPKLASFLSCMTLCSPLAESHIWFTQGGAGVRIHVIPVRESHFPWKTASMDIEQLSYWLEKYEGHIGVARCSAAPPSRS